MKTNIDQLFFRDAAIGNTASAETVSEALDVRMHGADRTKDLLIRIHVNNADEIGTTGSATVAVQTSTDGSTWTALSTATLSSSALDDNAEILLPYPMKPKQFLRLKLTTTTAFTVAPELFAGLDADAEYGIDEDLVEY